MLRLFFTYTLISFLSALPVKGAEEPDRLANLRLFLSSVEKSKPEFGINTVDKGDTHFHIRTFDRNTDYGVDVRCELDFWDGETSPSIEEDFIKVMRDTLLPRVFLTKLWSEKMIWPECDVSEN